MTLQSRAKRSGERERSEAGNASEAKRGTRAKRSGERERSEVAPFNAVNRGVYIADNLKFLRKLNSESIDLVCIDPPFAKNDTFNKADNELSPTAIGCRERKRESTHGSVGSQHP